MKNKAKKRSKTHTAHRAKSRPAGMQSTRVVSRSRVQKEKESETYTPMETGQPDQEAVPGASNPQGVQGGLGPTNQEGEGERQNDQLAELEDIEPDIK